jgi:hypothetical protein
VCLLLLVGDGVLVGRVGGRFVLGGNAADGGVLLLDIVLRGLQSDLAVRLLDRI